MDKKGVRSMGLILMGGCLLPFVSSKLLYLCFLFRVLETKISPQINSYLPFLLCYG